MGSEGGRAEGALGRSGGGHWEVGEQEGETGSSFLFPCVLACKEEFC